VVLTDGEVGEELVLERTEEVVVSGIGLEIDLPGRSGGVGRRRRMRTWSLVGPRRMRTQSPAGPTQYKKLQ
jgi:hypothetical protein